MSGKRTRKSSEGRPQRGRAELDRLRQMTEAEITESSPPELADLPSDFWDGADLVTPEPKEAISLRVDKDVLAWFRDGGPRYQTRMNAVLRLYMSRMKQRQAKRRQSRKDGSEQGSS